jgi:hypothetical protein
MKPNMKLLTNEVLDELRGDHETPCLSLYQPTHRYHPANQQDQARFRLLLKELKQSLEKNDPGAARSILEPFEALSGDRDFWNHTMDGLAVFGAPGLFLVCGLHRTVRELAVVAGSFHTKPLRQIL